MDITVLNTSFVAVDILEGIDSILWIEKYNSFGTFEIYTKYSDYHLELLQEGYYLKNSKSDRLMIIDSVNIATDPENGDKLIVSGRSLESILDRRIVLNHFWGIDNPVWEAIEIMIYNNFTNSVYPERNISNFVYQIPTDPNVTAPTCSVNYHGNNIYECVATLCQQNNIGFKILLNSSNQFVLSLYVGVDRSYSQSNNLFVVFSPDLDNLIRSDYYRSKRNKKNYILVIGQPFDGWIDVGQAWTVDVGTGLNRLETALDGSTISRTYEGTNTPIPDADYIQQLSQRGFDELLVNHQEIINFNGQVDLSKGYKYGVDFLLGDIIQMVDNYGHSSAVRVIEVTMSQNPSGETIIPTLASV